MAIIALDQSVSLDCSSWIFRSIMSGILHAAVDKSLVAKAEAALNDGSNFTELGELSQTQRDQLADCLNQMQSDINAYYPFAPSEPDLTEALASKISELREAIGHP